MEVESKPAFAQWCVLEIMGHVTVAGFVSEEIIFGVPLVRVDVPEVAEKRSLRSRYVEGQGYVEVEMIEPFIPTHTLYYGASSIYSLKPTTEEAAKARAAQLRHKSIDCYLPVADTIMVSSVAALPPPVEEEETDIFADAKESYGGKHSEMADAL